MPYRKVGNRVAFDLYSKSWFGPHMELPDLSFGFEIQRNPRKILVEAAKSCIGVSQFRSDAGEEAPMVVNCCSFTRWCYGQIGIWLPNSVLQQFEIYKFGFGDHQLEHSNPIRVSPGDLVFKRGRIQWQSETGCDVGHVGIVTEVDGDGRSGKVVHATKNHGVIESSLAQRFIATKRFRGARWIVPNFATLVTLTIPENLQSKIETSFDVDCLLSRPNK